MPASITTSNKRMAAGLTHYQRPYGDADRKQYDGFGGRLWRWNPYGGEANVTLGRWLAAGGDIKLVVEAAKKGKGYTLTLGAWELMREYDLWGDGDDGELPSIYEYKNGETITVDGIDYVLHDNKWLPLESKETYEKYLEERKRMGSRRPPVTREMKAIFSYNQKLVQQAGIEGALIGGTTGLITKFLTRVVKYTPIGLFAGYLGGQIDAYNEMIKRMEEHDKRVEYLRNKIIDN